ncbi:MAG: class I SAM-dependent methyltransferase [Geminicoccaceae bacterium]
MNGTAVVTGGAPTGVSPQPFPWIVRFAPRVGQGSPVLDLACGGGRHARLFLARGHPVTAVDVDVSGLDDLREHPALELVQADLENAPWPLPGRRFGVVVVTNYLWRPLFPMILDAVAEGGMLLYETFALGNAAYGRPSNPDFLLKPGELLEAVHGRLQIVAYEHGYLERPRPAIKQRLFAVRADRPAPLRSE